MAQDILKSFVGEALTPRRGGNLVNREFTGVRLSKLKKGQNQITFGKDVLEQLGNPTVPSKVSVIAGQDKHAGKLLVVFGAADGAFQLRHSNTKKPSSAHVMSSALPLPSAVSSAAFKVFPESKAVVIELPVTPAAAPAAASGDSDSIV